MTSGDDKHCPVCAQSNSCGMAEGKSSCWCQVTSFSPELIEFLATQGIDDRCLCARCAAGDVPSPCLEDCSLEENAATCRGCRRTVAEITAWPELGPVERARIHWRIREWQI
ncbi:MAG: cysteine-rich CWC family protein [Planctomycetota bacterium]